MGAFAWVTLATNDSYSLGALVLAHSLKQAGTAHQLAVLVTPGVTSAMRGKLASVFNLVQEVNILDSRDEANLRLLKRPELGITFTKLHCWRLTQFDKCVFLDADTLVLQNSDELFEREELSAAPDVGWPDCFNSGVFVYRPSLETYEKLIQFAIEKGSFDGGDQGLLNLYFSDWAHKDISKHLPFIYNLCSTACYSYLPAFKQFGAKAKIIHFIGTQKPWLQYFNTETKKVQPSGESSHLQEVLQLWWNIFCSLIHPHLSPEMAGLAGAFSQLTLGVARTVEQDALENVLRKQAWEVGNIDYLGKDSFENIWSKITETLSAAPSQPEASAPVEPEVPTPAPETEVAPAESQSQTALQEVASPVQSPVSPIDTPSDKTSVDTPKVDSLESSPLQESLITPSTEVLLPQTPLEAAPADVTTEPALESPVGPIEEVKQPEVSLEAKIEQKEEAGSALVETPIVAEIVEKTPVIADSPQEPSSTVDSKSLEPLEPIAAVQEPVIQAIIPEEPIASPIVATDPVVQTPPVQDPAPITIPTEPTIVKPIIPGPITAIPVTEQPAITESEAELAATPAAAVPPTEAFASAELVATPSGATSATEVRAPPEPEAISTAAVLVTETSVPVGLATSPPVEVPVTETPEATESATEVAAKPTKGSPKTKVVEATPPATPGTPPATPLVEKTKQALTAEASAPDTPPPSEGGSTPTPPPRKTDKPKKVAAKPKK